MQNNSKDNEWTVSDASAETEPAPAKRRVSNTDLHVRRTVATALFAALAYLMMFVFRIQVGFLTFDLKDAI
ncbi:MAG: hypothetical protein IKP74_07760 [Clostridia bacterium]|nr:hypothetical protein [Clostridia bacterium]